MVTVKAGVPELRRILGEGDCVASLLRQPSNLGHEEIECPTDWKPEGDEAPREAPHHSSMCQSL